MTQLRDARLQRALDEAPDAALRPPQRIRSAVLEAARVAVEPAVPRWRRLLPGEGRGGARPWNAAFATVLLAMLVGVIWHGRDVPGGRPQADAADPPMPTVPAPVPKAEAPAAGDMSAVPSAGPTERSGEPAQPPAAAKAAPALRDVPRTRELPARAVERGAPECPHPNPSPGGEGACAPAGGGRQDASAGSAPAGQEAPAAAGMPAPPAGGAPPAAMAPPPAIAPAPAMAPPPAAAPPPAPAPPSAMAVPAAPALRREAEAAAEAQERRADNRAAPPSLRAQRQSLSAAEAPWDQVRLERHGASVVVPRAESGQLASLLAALQRASAPAVPADAPLTERITLQQDGRTVAVLQMGEGDTVLWQSAAPGEPSRVMRPPASLLRALREELAQRLPR